MITKLKTNWAIFYFRSVYQIGSHSHEIAPRCSSQFQKGWWPCSSVFAGKKQPRRFGNTPEIRTNFNLEVGTPYVSF